MTDAPDESSNRPSAGPVAVIDIGTISTRLAVLDAEAAAGRPGVEIRDAIVTHTGEGLRTAKRISADALDRLRSCLQQYRTVIDDAGAASIRVVSTAVARNAANVDELGRVVRDVIGVDLVVLTGQQEAELAFAGAVRGLASGGSASGGLDDRSMILVIDVGGGSTEFSLGSLRDGFERGYSADVGASLLTDAYLFADPPAADELSAALSIVELHVDDVRREVPGLADALGPSGTVIGVGGTISTMASVEIGLPVYDRGRLHGFVLDRPAAEDVFRTLATEAAEDRAFNPGLEADRVDLIVGGACVVVETMRQLDIEELLVSQSDLIDGLAAEMLSPT